MLGVVVALLFALTRSLTGATGGATVSITPPGGAPATLLSIPGTGTQVAGGPGGGTASGPFGSPVNGQLPKPPSSAEPWKPGPGQLHGSDTSEWQTDAEFQDAIKNDQFAVIKATQGTGFVDKTFAPRWKELGDKVASGAMALRVAYVFLDKGDGQGQARHFLDTVGIHGTLPAGTRLALDWEAAALQDPGTLKAAGEYVHQVTGAWPLVYVQGSSLSVAKNTLPDAPMWEAAWGPSPDKSLPFVQYSDGPVYDHDVFNGDVAALRKFAGES